MKFTEKVSVRAVKQVCVALAGTLAMNASAQLVAPSSQQQDDPETSSIHRVEVTGSNIKRVSSEVSSPIESISRIQIQESGASTVAELLKKVTAMGSGGAFDARDGGFSKGAATASLRGLGSSSTLILLNGRRMTASAYANPNLGQSTLYDLNSIPISALDRVEIFKDGASAVYGSDAIAGVINFITKQNYQGVEVTATTKANQDGEFGKSNANIFAGIGDIENDGYNAFISLDFTNKDRTTVQNARGIRAGEYLDMNQLSSPYYSFASDQPFFFKERTPGSNTFYTSGTATSPNIINRTNCDKSQLLTGRAQYNILPSSYLYGRQFCNYDGRPFQEAQGAAQDISLLSRGTLKINPDLSIFTEVAYTNSTRKYTGVSRTIDGRTATTAFPQYGAGALFQPALPIGHPDNPFTDARAAVVYRFANIPGGSENESNTYRVLTGIKGNNFNWDWESGLLWNRADRDMTNKGFILMDGVQKLISENKSLYDVAHSADISRSLLDKNSAEIIQLDGKASTEFG